MPEILTSEQDVEWLPKPNRVEFLLDSTLPEVAAITGVYVFAFQDGLLLLNLHAERGWDLPGMDGDVGADPAATLERVVRERTHVELAGLAPLGYFRLRFPPRANESYVAIYVARVAAVHAFSPGGDLRERKLFAPSEAARLEVLVQYAAIYQAVLARIG